MKEDLDSNSLHSLESNKESATDGEVVSARQQERETLARKEDVAVRGLRVTLFLVLLLATIGMALFVYNFVRSNQTKDFETAYEAYATKILETFHASMASKVEGIDALATSITSYAMATNATFPFVTIPDFEMRGANTRVLAGVSHMNWYPVVQEKDRRAFEKYILERKDEVWDKAVVSENEQLSNQDERLGGESEGRGNERSLNDRNLQDDSEKTQGAPPAWTQQIYQILANGTRVPMPENSGPYSTTWQISPAIEQFRATVLYNVFTQPQVSDVLLECYRTGMAVLDGLSVYEGIEQGKAAAFVRLTLARGQYRFNGEELYLDPSTALAYPVFDSFERKNRQVVGFLGATLYWKFYLRNILPPTTAGIYCVLTNTLGETLTYRVDGEHAEYIGNAALHDESYAKYERSSTLGAVVQGLTSAATTSYSSVEINFDYMDYTVHVYPSKETEEQFRNNDPLVFTGIIIGVFAFTSLVFVTYDCLVSRRQRIVMDRAVASSAIVSSLYPSQVREQIYKQTDDAAAGKGDDAAVKSFMSGDKGVANLSGVKSNAHVYDNTTIFFADLVGFTRWSATRQPEQVFALLESIYSAFDRIAARRKVFKVETIGDCYVAATGLPYLQEAHAAIMAKFADDCLRKVDEITKHLADTLGEDTTLLQLRVGIHSGKVTGGCLRGQKARFQLFGDTMNTASRMESNGVGGKIQCSQETAAELTRLGKSAWVSAREDKIVVKGKGELQTFWVLPRRAATSVASQTHTVKPETTFGSNRGEGTTTGETKHFFQQHTAEAEEVDRLEKKLELWATRRRVMK